MALAWKTTTNPLAVRVCADGVRIGARESGPLDVLSISPKLDISAEPFTMEEYIAVKSKLKLGKAAYPDGIPPEALKLCDFHDIMLSFANKLFLAGVLQGDTLAPYPFVIVLDFIMRQTLGERETDFGFELESRKSSRHPAVVVNDLDFADDIAQ
ncbi:hypothetical protein Bbelb_276150 [Branchiostoma belcheri]|nr:hypothetical protein Bbelb_276150 [Branchiostoma belcheri]